MKDMKPSLITNKTASLKTTGDTKPDPDSVLQTNDGQDPAKAPVTIREGDKDPGRGGHQVQSSCNNDHCEDPAADGLLEAEQAQATGQPPLHHQLCVDNNKFIPTSNTTLVHLDSSLKKKDFSPCSNGLQHDPGPVPVHGPLQAVQTHGLHHDPGPVRNRLAADLTDEEGPHNVRTPAADELQDDGQHDAPALVGDVGDAEHVHVPSRAHSPVDGEEAQPAPEPDPAPARDQQVATPQDGGQQQPRQPPVAMKFISGKGVDVIKDLPKRKKK